MKTSVRITLIHLTSVTLLIACAILLNVLVWSAPPSPFPDTLWNHVFLPAIRILAAIGSIGGVLYGATSPVVWRLLRMHRQRPPS